MEKELEALKRIKQAIAEHLHKQTGVSVEKHFEYLQNDTDIEIVTNAINEHSELKRRLPNLLETAIQCGYGVEHTSNVELQEQQIINEIISKVGKEELKPYKTAHDKLIEMGLNLKITENWMGGVFSHEWWNDNDNIVLSFYVNEKVTTVYEANNEIMNVIPQYLEEMEEIK